MTNQQKTGEKLKSFLIKIDTLNHIMKTLEFIVNAASESTRKISRFDWKWAFQAASCKVDNELVQTNNCKEEYFNCQIQKSRNNTVKTSLRNKK